MQKKYKIVKKLKHPDNSNLFRIQALKAIPEIYVKKGDIGGFVEGEHNLSHRGTCWVFDNARVHGQAAVVEHALVKNNAAIYNFAYISTFAKILDDSRIYDHAKICGESEVYNDSNIGGFSQVHNSLIISRKDDPTVIVGNSIVRGPVKNTKDLLLMGPFGRHPRYITYNKNDKKVAIGCFYGTIKELKLRLKESYSSGDDYYTAIKFIQIFDRDWNKISK